MVCSRTDHPCSEDVSPNVQNVFPDIQTSPGAAKLKGQVVSSEILRAVVFFLIFKSTDN